MSERLHTAAEHYSCAECGTDAAGTYVVTVLDAEDPDSRTEVCRACDDALRGPELLEAALRASSDWDRVQGYRAEIAALPGKLAAEDDRDMSRAIKRRGAAVRRALAAIEGMHALRILQG